MLHLSVVNEHYHKFYQRFHSQRLFILSSMGVHVYGSYIEDTLERMSDVAKPKSPIFTWSLESKKMLTGFKSRCIIPYRRKKFFQWDGSQNYLRICQ